MTTTSTLVILGSSITALAVARDAHAHGLRPVVVDRRRGIASRSRWVDCVPVADLDDDATLASLHGCAGPDAALVASADQWLRFVVEHRPALDAAFGRVLHPPNTMLQVCLHKGRFAIWCRGNDLPTPPFWLPGSGPERPATLHWPMLLRPCQTLHEHAAADLPKAVEVDTERDLQAWIGRFQRLGATPIVSQSLLRQRLTQYSVPFARNAAGSLSFVARKLRPAAGRCAQGSLVEWCHDETARAAQRLALRAIECADYQGIGEVEILHSHDTDHDHLVEINARPWLQYALAPATGHDLLGWMLHKRMARHATPRGGRTWINLRDDRFQAFSPAARVPRDERPGLAAYLRSIARSNVYALFDPRDPMPFIRTVLRRP